MNRMEKHLKKVQRAHANIDDTMAGIAAQLADLKSHRLDIAAQIVENNNIINELTNINERLTETDNAMQQSISDLEKLLQTN